MNRGAIHLLHEPYEQVCSDRTDMSADPSVVVLPDPDGPTTRIIPC